MYPRNSLLMLALALSITLAIVLVLWIALNPEDELADQLPEVIATSSHTSTNRPSLTPTVVPPSPTLSLPTDIPDSTATATVANDPLALPVSRNTDWDPVSQAFDGVEMVLVPAGCFMMGSNAGEDNERPVNEQCFNQPFWLDRFEVTNALYGSTACASVSSESDQPRNCVTWFEARDFCESRGGRLPTEAEWEYAARGPDGLIYPWGNNFVSDYVVWDENSDSKTATVGSRPEGESWVGALDMAGNLWEWTSTRYQDYPYRADDGREEYVDGNELYVLRGGSYFNTSDKLSASYRLSNGAGTEISFNGFRCARSY